MNESPDLLRTLLGDDGAGDDAALEAILSMASARVERGEDAPSDEDVERLMREQWGLPVVDVAAAARSTLDTAVYPDDQDADDYTDEEWLIVKTMRKLCLDVISRETPIRRRKFALEWTFVRGVEEPRYGVDFHLACDMLKARHWVIQALVQHFWYLRCIEPEPLPFLADPLPEAIEGEAILHAWDEGIEIMRRLWMLPGRAPAELRFATPNLSPEAFDRGFDRLADAGLIGLSAAGKAYVISRPVTFRARARKTSWSRSFLGD